MASYAPSSITPQGKEDAIPLQQPVEDDSRESAELLPRLKKVPHIRALTALALFCPTGIIALIFSILAGKQSQGGSRKADEKAEKYTILSYRIGVVVIFTLAMCLAAGIVIIIVHGIEVTHIGERF